ncbi:hypothetical protein D5F01_LYC00467 [Larimichthys crocea]|uniref:Uncharacterized protein n=1 Tax=Larimichthys crocea TaxID=215358 RepID=A0A6G0J9D1_LARCR|nr:hypothetical protein D5F01_LYC00467 [Larimichthys crocea]
MEQQHANTTDNCGSSQGYSQQRQECSRSKDKTEQGRKAPGRSGSRSSNISKASNSTTGLTTARTSITPSSQDICSSSQLPRLEEDASESHKHNKRTHTSVMTVTSTALSSSAQVQKKQVKRRHRRKRSSCSALNCVETIGKQEQQRPQPQL